MTPADLKSARAKLRMTQAELARAKNPAIVAQHGESSMNNALESMAYQLESEDQDLAHRLVASATKLYYSRPLLSASADPINVMIEAAIRLDPAHWSRSDVDILRGAPDEPRD